MCTPLGIAQIGSFWACFVGVTNAITAASDLSRKTSVLNLRVSDLMTRDVFVARPDEPLATVQELMNQKRIRHVPVIDERGLLVGLVSERDLLRLAAGLESDLPLSVTQDVASALEVREVMTWHVETVEANESAAAAAAVMLENKYGCLPALDQGRLVGILTEADFVRFVADAPVRSALS